MTPFYQAIASACVLLYATDCCQVAAGYDDPSLGAAKTPEELRAAHSSLGDFFENQAKYQEAEMHYTNAIHISVDTMKVVDRRLANDYLKLAGVQLSAGNTDGAVISVARAITAQRKIMRSDDADVACACDTLAAVLIRKGRLDEAEEQFSKAMTIRKKALASDDIMLHRSSVNMGYILNALGKQAEAARVLNEAIESINLLGKEQQTKPAIRYILSCLHANLAHTYRSQGMLEEAVARAKMAMSIQEEQLPDRPQDFANSTITVASLHRQAGNAAEARKVLDASARKLKTILGNDHPVTHSIQQVDIESQDFAQPISKP